MTGPDELQAFLDAQGISSHRFALEHGFDPVQIRKLLNRRRLKVSVDLADKLERATKGAVGWRSWLRSEEEKEQPNGEQEDTEQK